MLPLCVFQSGTRRSRKTCFRIRLELDFSLGSAICGVCPDGRLMRRVAQIGDGKIFGSVEFVRETAFALGDRFRSRSVAARAVGELGFATHGWRLAGAAENVVA